MPMPIAISQEQLNRIDAHLVQVELLIAGKQELNLVEAQSVGAQLGAAYAIVISAIKKVLEPQHDAPAVSNDVHGAQSR